MSTVVFVLSLILLVAGAVSGYASLDLLPTGIGVLYALAGAVAVSAAVVTFAIAVAIRRIDGLAKLVRQPASPANGNFVEGADTAPAEETPKAYSIADVGEPESLDEPVSAEDETPANENRAGHLPSLEEIETPEPLPSLIGRYSSGGANYMIFADGSIEAETDEGTFKFASMGDFKRYLVESKGGKAG